MRRAGTLAGLCLLLNGCFAAQGGAFIVDDDVPADAALPDAPAPEAPPPDAPPPDAPAPDALAPDAPPPDAPAPDDSPAPDDAPAPDAPPPDAPAPDDALSPDAPTPDAPAPDVVCRTRCSGFCVDTMTDVGNCGGCGNDCALRPGVDPARVRCEAGACVFTEACLPGRAHCSADADDGCEAVVSTSMRCGGCATACPASAPNCGRMAGAPNGYACTSACVDPTPMRCGALCVDPQTDPANCGACGRACPTTPGGAPMCAAGACRVVCSMGFDNCDGNPTNGCEAAVATDARNCGACGNACPGTVPCTAGACACATGSTRCGDACVDVQTDARHCGACGRACPTTAAFCMAGSCVAARPTRYVRAPAPPPISDFVNACGMPGATTALASVDDSRTAVALAFPFRFWASDLTAGAMVNVSSNGFLNLDGSAASNLSGSVPSAGTPNGTVAAYWGDNYNRSPGQCFLTLGAAPSRRQVFQWNDAHHCCTNDPAVHHTYEVVLHEAGTIDVLYQTMMGAVARTAGLENPTGTAAVSGCPDGTSYTCAPATGYAVRYVPTP